MKVCHNIFDKIISLENLFSAWQNFKSNKTRRKEIKEFEFHLEDNLFKLFNDLKTGKYHHGPYSSFYINDPKLRLIHKANIRDRIVHQAVYQILNPVFESIFIPDSYSSRKTKGSHKAVYKLRKYLLGTSRNNTNNCWIVKCDIKKFFDSVDH